MNEPRDSPDDKKPMIVGSVSPEMEPLVAEAMKDADENGVVKVDRDGAIALMKALGYDMTSPDIKEFLGLSDEEVTDLEPTKSGADQWDFSA